MSNMTTPQHHNGHHPDGHAAGHPTDHGHHDAHNGAGHDAGATGYDGYGYAHPAAGPAGGAAPGGGAAAHGPAAHGGPAARSHSPKHGRDKIDWGPEVWKRIDAAVKEEITRSRVAAKFLPIVHVPAKATTVQADVVSLSLNEGTTSVGALSVDETATTRINEYWVEFALTPAQVEEEAAAGAHPDAHHAAAQHHGQHGHGHHHGAHHHGHASTAVSLATRAANILAQVEDSIIFQGQNALGTMLIGGANSAVNFRVTPGTLDLGLLNVLLPGGTLPALIGGLTPQQIIQVHPTSAPGAPPGSYQGNTVAAVAQAFAILQSMGQYGAYALVLQTTPFADAHSPLPTTLITPAEPIRHLMNAGFFGTGTLPPFLSKTGTAGAGVPGQDSLLSITITAGGTGYDPTNPPAVTIDAPPGGGATKPIQATAIAVVSPGGQVTGVTLTNPGAGYAFAAGSTPPKVTIAAPTSGTQATATAAVVGLPTSSETTPPQVLYTGLVVSLGGNTMDLVRGKMNDEEDVIVRFEQKDVDGNYRFRVVERFALRLKDVTAVVQLQFMSS